MRTSRHLLIVVLAVGVVGCGTVAPSKLEQAAALGSGAPHKSTTPKSRWDLREKKVLDAAIKDVLTNPSLSSTREFYGGSDVRTVRYSGFPVGYRPEVAGYLFEPCASPGGGRGLRLTICLSGIWIDQPLPKNTYPFCPPTIPERAVILGIYNSGDLSIDTPDLNHVGGCCVGYAVEQASDGWRVVYVRSEDP